MAKSSLGLDVGGTLGGKLVYFEQSIHECQCILLLSTRIYLAYSFRQRQLVAVLVAAVDRLMRLARTYRYFFL
jgi:hypothetical protein